MSTDLTDRSKSFVQLALLGLAATLGCDKGGGGGGGGGGGAGNNLPKLNDIAAETAYAQNSGTASQPVLWFQDGSVSTALAKIQNDQRIVLYNSNLFASFTPLQGEFYRYHELGHHYLDCMHTMQSCKFAEYQADAFAARVFLNLHGLVELQSLYPWIQASLPSQVHRSGPERLSYVIDVAAAALQSWENCPLPPTSPAPPPATGFLRISNPLFEPAYLWIEGVLYGQYLAQSSVTMLPVNPGNWQVLIQGVFSFTYINYGVKKIDRGEETTAP